MELRKKNINCRVPNDIDIIISDRDWRKLSSIISSKRQFRTEYRLWNIPIELHRSGALVTPDEHEISEGRLGLDTLLEKNINKLYRNYIGYISENLELKSERLTDVISIYNFLSNLSGGFVDKYKGDKNNMITWFKTLGDIKDLIDAGATLSDRSKLLNKFKSCQSESNVGQQGEAETEQSASTGMTSHESKGNAKKRKKCNCIVS